MYNIEIHKRINEIMLIFYRLAIGQSKEQSNYGSNMAWKSFYLIFYLSFVVSLMLGGLLSDDWNESIFLISMCTATVLATVKLYYILWKHEEICAFIQDIGAHSITDFEVFIKLNENVKKLMKFSTNYCLATIVGCGLLIIFSLPLFSSDTNLPLNIWFPFDWKKNVIAYWTAYACVTLGIIFSTVAALLNIIIWYLMMNCAIKYQILGNQFKNIFSPKPTTKKRKISKDKVENLFLQEFIGLIKAHRNTKETIDRFKSCFGNVFLTQIITSGISICGSVYALAFVTHDETVIHCMFYVVALFFNLFDIFMVTYLGNQIKLSSDQLSYCLFESDWLERSSTLKRSIIILNEVLKQPHELIIGILYPLNMETFLSIVHLAYSMFSILNNLN